MNIDDDLILKLEHLARLNLSVEERASIKNDLGKIFQMFEKLSESDTKDVQPFIHFEGVDRLSEDKVGSHTTNENALKNAPEKMKPYFSVPKIID